MKNGHKKNLSVPGVLKEIIESGDDVIITQNENRLVCMFLSPCMFAGAVINFLVMHMLNRYDLKNVLYDSFIFLAIGILAELLMRMETKLKVKEHFISALLFILFVFITFRFYFNIGPSLWTVGFILLLFSMMRINKTMLIYTGSAICISFLYIAFIYTGTSYQMGLTYYILQMVFFGLMFLVAFSVYKINWSRFKKINRQLLAVNREIDLRKEAEEKNIRMALYDQLTNLPNRALFYDRIEQALQFAEMNDTDFYVLFIDLDYFKMINDSMGHSQGDNLLIQVAERLTKELRKGDTVARIGGDEFVILLQNVTQEQPVQSITGRILSQINKPYYINQMKISISCSIGICKYPEDGSDTETLLKHADLAMYKAKDEGKNRYANFNETLVAAIDYEMDLFCFLQSKIEQNDLSLYYQPLINCETDEIIGFEALVRLIHPTLGVIYPKDFVPLAEKTGLILAMGEWIIKTACIQNKTWQEQGIAFVPVSVNLSAHQFNHSLVSQIERILKETDLDPMYLELEITEAVLIKEFKNIKSELERVKEIGVKISIDDFGKGYSSIHYIKDLLVDQIKIPIDYIRGIDNDSKDESIITAILSLAENLNVNVVAEGVETINQLQFLRQRNCRNIQGYYFYKPMPAENIEDCFRKSNV